MFFLLTLKHVTLLGHLILVNPGQGIAYCSSPTNEKQPVNCKGRMIVCF